MSSLVQHVIFLPASFLYYLFSFPFEISVHSPTSISGNFFHYVLNKLQNVNIRNKGLLFLVSILIILIIHIGAKISFQDEKVQVPKDNGLWFKWPLSLTRILSHCKSFSCLISPIIKVRWRKHRILFWTNKRMIKTSQRKGSSTKKTLMHYF